MKPNASGWSPRSSTTTNCSRGQWKSLTSCCPTVHSDSKLPNRSSGQTKTRPTSRLRSRWRIAPKSFRHHRCSVATSASDSEHPRAWAMDADKLRTLFDLTDRTVIVTGATRGIGFSLAEGYLAAGANVVVTGRSQDRCDEAE